MISVIIPVYNGEKYLAECIESVLEQTYDDYEIILVNDGSIDGTEQMIINYQKKHPDKIRSVYKSNGGTASALNEGIKCMKGDWFKWLSADDKFNDRHALSDMIRLISTIPNHKDYIFYTNYNIIDENSKLVKPFDEPDRTHLIRDLRNAELLHNFYGNGSSSLIHRKLIDEIGLFRENMSYGEDLEYWLRATLQFGHTLYHLPLRTIQYRVHGDSLTGTKNLSDNAKFVKEICEKFETTAAQKEYLKKLQSMEPLRRKILPHSVRAKILEWKKK